MWDLYDELYIAIPSGILVEGCVVGKTWTTVRANGHIGVAKTLGIFPDDADEIAQSMIGEPLREVANHLKWDGLIKSSIGVAAMNSFYNVPDNIEDGCTPDFANDISGRIAIIGDLPNLEAGLGALGDVISLPLPESSELGEIYEEAMSGDYVFVSGDALTNRTLPYLLKNAGKATKISLVGVSVPAAPVLFAFDNPVHVLSGVYSIYDTTVESAAKLDIQDLKPGTKPFCITPYTPLPFYKREEISRYKSSPYRASAFNCAFNPWEGRQYNSDTWSPVFKG